MVAALVVAPLVAGIVMTEGPAGGSVVRVLVALEVLPQQRVRARPLREKASTRASVRLAVRSLEARSRERRRRRVSRRIAPASEAGRGSCLKGEPGRRGVLEEAFRTPGRAAAAPLQELELV